MITHKRSVEWRESGLIAIVTNGVVLLVFTVLMALEIPDIHAKHGKLSCIPKMVKIFSLRRTIRLLCWLSALFEALSYRNHVMSLHPNNPFVDRTSLLFYTCHLTSQSLINVAFCLFGLLW